MTTIYKPFGCFNNSSKDSFKSNLTKLTNKKYTIKECNEAAVQNKSDVFGLVRDGVEDIGTCFLSDSNLSTLEQSFRAVKNGIVIEGCRDEFGNTENDSIFVHLNNKALNFFQDLGDVDKKAELSEKPFLDQLKNLNSNFNEYLNNFKISIQKDFKPYVNNDLNKIFKEADFSDIDIIEDKFQKLFKNITVENLNIFNKIEKLNKEIQILDSHIVKAKQGIHNITISDNAALGNVADINFRNISILGENITLVIIPLVLLGLYIKQIKSE